MTAPRHDLDHASTTPLRPSSRDAMVETLTSVTGDPSRVHTEGTHARAVLEDARERVGAAFGARAREVVFTSGATESIATACWGAAERGTHQVVPAVEHSAVRLSAAMHGPVRSVGVDGHGRVSVDEMLAAVDDQTAAVHLQWGNHEVGTTQPVDEVVAACRDRGVLVHVDAAQAAGRIPIDFRALGADLVSISGHKLGGPPGSGVLLVRRGVRLRPLLVGGEQELARRAGLENVAAAVGLAAAVDSIDVDSEAATQVALTDRLRDQLVGLEGVTIHGDPLHRLPHLVCIGIADIEPQAVLFGLDRRGISAHSGSACASADLEPSPVLAAMGVDAHRSLRLSVGWSSTDADVDAVAAALPAILTELRSLRPTH
ncbi:cysteine desulfurase family protein [Actinospongicola halichondriae]|uniref:cysteine desulfurase family protein n=1 Tax=Actinospongicola halichondriae TaxID=3236844 RepID=UPI003D4D0688